MADVTNYKVFKNVRFEVLTDQGFKDFRGLIVGTNSNKIRLTFSNGTALTCTPNHKVITNKKFEWRYAKDLKVGSRVFGNISLVSKHNINNEDPVFEFLHVADNHRYFCNGVLSRQCLILDELAFVPNQVIEEFWDSVIPVISSSNKTQIFVVSTPNGTQNQFYELYTQAERGESGWTAERVDWWEVPGRTDRWRKRMIDDLGSSERFDQEFGNQFIEVGQSPFSKEVFDDLRSSKTDPKYAFVDAPNGFEPQEKHDEFTTYRVWKEAQPHHTYSIGVDVGEGVGRAASVVAVLDITDLTHIELVAMYHNRRIQPVEFATKILKIAQHYGNPNVLIERNNCGGQVVDSLYNIHQYTRLVDYSPTNPNQKYYNRLGIYSHSNSKYKGVTNMRYWFDQLKVCRVYDIATTHEFEIFVRHPNGTWSHQPGEHNYDDRVMAIVWALFLLEKEIAEKYLSVLEYDATGRPSKVQDPYGETVNYDELLIKSSQRSLFGSSLSSPSVSLIGQRGSAQPNDELADLLAAGWSLANPPTGGYMIMGR